MPTQPVHPAVAESSRVRLRPLVIRAEDGEYVVGSLHNGEFVALPEVGKRAIELLDRGATVEQAQDQLRHEYAAEVTLLGFVEQLRDLGFVQSIDDRPIDGGSRIRSHLPGLRPEHLRWLFSRPIAAGYAGVVVGAVIALALRPELVPTYEKFLWLDRVSVVLVVNLAMVIAAAWLHELGHLVAARSVGLPARITLGTRLYSLVAQTDIRCVWAVPRRLRCRVYLAGLAVDLFLLSAAIIVAALVDGARPALGALSLLIFLSAANQLQLFLRTDLYGVAMELARAKNLYQDASAYLIDRLRRIVTGTSRWFTHRPARPVADPLALLPARERAVVRLYAIVMVAGTVASFCVYILYLIPILVATAVRATGSVRTGLAAHDAITVLDGATTLAIQATLHIVFVVVLFKGRAERVRRLRARLR